MHADDFEQALPWLQKGAGFHRENAPREYARSLCYVAQCLRGLQRDQEALELVREALTFAADPRYATAEKTKAYLRLEEGRALLAYGRPAEARGAFEYVVDCQADDAEHPRISGARGPILRSVAALALGDALAWEPNPSDRTLWITWRRFFPNDVARARLVWRVRTYVY